jgi:hypothetical protein
MNEASLDNTDLEYSFVTTEEVQITRVNHLREVSKQDTDLRPVNGTAVAESVDWFAPVGGCGSANLCDDPLRYQCEEDFPDFVVAVHHCKFGGELGWSRGNDNCISRICYMEVSYFVSKLCFISGTTRIVSVIYSEITGVGGVGRTSVLHPLSVSPSIAAFT